MRNQSFLSKRLKRMASWAAFALIAVWLALTANAWRYFSGAGLERAYLAAIHAIDVLHLPAAKTPSHLGDKRALSKGEHEELTRYQSLLVSHVERPNENETYSFDRPNVATRYPGLGIGVYFYQLHYVILEDRFCELPTSTAPAHCYNYYRDSTGRIFLYYPRSGPIPAQWRRVTPVESE